MNKIFKLAAALAVLCLGSASASAGIINFSFTNDGVAGVSGSCGTGCVLLQSAGIAQASGGSNESWLFQGTMKIYEGSPDLGFGAGSGLGWSFTDLNGNNDLFGTFTAVGNIIALFSSSSVSYTVLGGSGLFDGAVGAGSSTIKALLGIFHEEGTMTVYTNPASVPEPGITTMLLAGFGMMGFLFYRRRRSGVSL
jgi:PEP-CTERM motif